MTEEKDQGPIKVGKMFKLSQSTVLVLEELAAKFRTSQTAIVERAVHAYKVQQEGGQ